MGAVVQHHDVVHIRSVGPQRPTGLHDERAEQSLAHLQRGVVMRVVHMGACVRDGELVRVALPRLDRRLGYVGHAILVVRNLHPVEVDDGGLGQPVDELHPHSIALPYPDLGTGHLAVIGPGLHPATGLHFPLDLLGGELVNLDPLLEPRLQELVALPLRLGGKGLHALLVHGIHGRCPLLRGEWCRRGGWWRGRRWSCLRITAGRR